MNMYENTIYFSCLSFCKLVLIKSNMLALKMFNLSTIINHSPSIHYYVRCAATQF